MISCLRLLIVAAVCAVLSCPATAGPVFDDLLNTMVIDQSPPMSGDNYLEIARDKPYGQTFVTGENVALLCRIAVQVAYWNPAWEPGESLVCTLWDSPAKKTKLGADSITYERRQWAGGILMFSVESPVQPNADYYFELTVDGGDGKIVGILLAKDYAKGQAYEAGKPQSHDLWFETHVKSPDNRDKNMAEFFGNFNLDYTGMDKVKTAVSAKAWDTACKEFLIHFEGRKDLFFDELATPKLDPKFDTSEADLAAQQKLRADGGSIVDLGPNWNYSATWPTRGGVGLTRTGLMKPLAFTYTNTGDEKYARAWNDMLISMFRNAPCPLKSGVITTDGILKATIPHGISAGPQWASISIAARIHHETFYNRFMKTPLFTQDARMGWWMNLTDMVNMLTRMDAGGNWKTQNDTALFSFAQKYPEYKRSAEWYKLGFDGIKKNFMDNMFSDGPCREATTGYHGFSLIMFTNAFQRARDLGLEIPKDILQRLENSFEYTMYNTQADWTVPIWGDTNRPADPTGLIKMGADFFKRADMLWVGTNGKQGKKPEHTSIAFPDAGYFIMRTGWDPKAKFLVTRNGLSTAHYHLDNLSIIANAYGVDLLPDPGIYIYDTPECTELVLTRQHSTICVDDKSVNRGGGENVFTAQPQFDYFRGTSPEYVSLKDVKTTRSIVFVKPDYWVVADWVKGPGEHTVDQRWRLAPGTAELDPLTGIARSTNPKGGNIEIIPIRGKGVRSELTQNVFAFTGTSAGKAPTVVHERKGALPMAFCTVLYPYPVSGKPNVRAEELACSDTSLDGAVMGAKITRGASVDYVVFDSANKEASFENDGLSVSAESAVVRTDARSGKVTGFSWYAGHSLSFGKEVLAISGPSVKALDVSYAKGVVTVNVDEDAGVAGLSVATLGARKAIVNGKAVTLAKGAKEFQPVALTF